MIIKTNTPTKINNQFKKVMNELYHLEDLNEYKNNTIGKVIDILQKVEFR